MNYIPERADFVGAPLHQNAGRGFAKRRLAAVEAIRLPELRIGAAHHVVRLARGQPGARHAHRLSHALDHQQADGVLGDVVGDQGRAADVDNLAQAIVRATQEDIRFYRFEDAISRDLGD